MLSTGFDVGTQTGAVRVGNVFTSHMEPGFPMSPWNLYSFVPCPADANNVAPAYTFAAAGYMPLNVSTNATTGFVAGQGTLDMGSTLVGQGYQGVSNVVQLDVPRKLRIVGNASATAQTVTIWGWDDYGQAITESLTGPGNNATVNTRNAYRYIRAIYCAAGTTGTYTVGTTDIFGLPCRVDSNGYIYAYYTRPAYTLALAATPIATVAGSNIITVTLTANTTGIYTPAVGDFVTISGAVMTDTTQVTEIVNNTYPINTVTGSASFTFISATASTSTAATTGGTTVVLNFQKALDRGTFTAADLTAPNLTTTSDVRGTYQPSVATDGIGRLNIFMYPKGADASQPAQWFRKIFPTANPLTLTASSGTVAVNLPNHYATVGDAFNLQGIVSSDATLTSLLLNSYFKVASIVDANNFTFAAGTNATTTAVNGGSSGSILWTYMQNMQIPQVNTDITLEIQGDSQTTLLGNTPYTQSLT